MSSSKRRELAFSTYMHARLPARNDILDRIFSAGAHDELLITHIEEYTPGNFASATDCGRGSSHLSGLNSLASGPQISSERLTVRIGIATVVPCATVMWSTTSPDAVVIGLLRGITSSHAAFKEASQWTERRSHLSETHLTSC